jgi:lysine 2,3-aminomutase
MSDKSLVLQEKVYTRAPYWQDVPDEQWMDWRWQMSNRLNSVEELGRVINLTASEKKPSAAKACSG